MYAHHHGYLHWDATLDPSVETMFRAFAAHGYEVASFVFDTNYLFKDLPEANVLGTSESLDGAFAFMRENREKPFLLYVHNWATHMPYDIVHADRKNWLAAKQEVIAGHPVRLGVGARGDAGGLTGRRSSGQSEELVALVPRGAAVAQGCLSRRRSRSSPTTASRGASASVTRPT
jgi:hypothetical protein